jgi:outer membrane protein assembly factor BamB
MGSRSSRRAARSAWLAGGALLAGWLAYRKLRPVIERVSLVNASSGEIEILGRGFGRRQGASTLRLRVGDEQVALGQATSWSDRRIAARLPATDTGGLVQVVRHTRLARLASAPVPFVVQAPGLPSAPYGYEVPVQAASPWPTFRRDHRNTGRSPIPARYHGDQPWSFQTGKGIFSTPVIDALGTIYTGSADHNFYALNPDSTEKWRFETGEVIDSAGTLPCLRAGTGEATVVFPSGDGYLRCLRAGDGALLWSFDARESPRASYNNWFEANVAIGYDGVIYAGNTNFNYYALGPGGTLRWTYGTGANAWSQAAFGQDGTIFWASCDSKIRAVRPDGTETWSRRTLGFISASAAVGSDGTLYIGSFDSYLYALDPATGRVRWKFKTGDHIYGSVALGADAIGNTAAIYFGSTDGSFYALDPAGSLLWAYDTGAPIRSSPALGRAPEGEAGDVVYFGCGNGRLYALNAADGTRRWSFDTTPDGPESRDRNDLNGSPALGERGVYIGGEHGQLWYVPYDYALHVADERCQTGPGEELPANVAGLFYVTPGGNTQPEGLPLVSPATILTLRLIVRQDGQTVNAWLHNSPIGRRQDALRVRAEPDFPFELQTSADGRYLHLVPTDFLEPDTTYTLHAEGDYYTGGLPIGNLTLGGRRAGRFQTTFTFRTRAFTTAGFPLRLGPDAGSRTPAFEWTRLAVPIPPMLPSLNQIGFDYMDWIVAAVKAGEPDGDGRGRCILWAIGGRRDQEGVLVADPDSDFTLALSGAYRGDAFVLTNRSFTMEVTGIPIPFNLFELRGQLGSDLRVLPGATAYADTQVLSIPTFGPLLVLAGLANNWWQKLLAVGTYVTRPYPQDGPANRRPPGISVASLDYTAPTRRRAGRVSATFRLAAGVAYPLAEHRPGILLVDADRTEAVYLDYHANLRATADGAGNLRTVTLTIPPGNDLPQTLEAIVLLDVFPISHGVLRNAAGAGESGPSALTAGGTT